MMRTVADVATYLEIRIMSKKSASAPRTPMTPSAVRRIHSAEALSGGGQVSAKSFTARAQHTVAQSTAPKKP